MWSHIKSLNHDWSREKQKRKGTHSFLLCSSWDLCSTVGRQSLSVLSFTNRVLIRSGLKKTIPQHFWMRSSLQKPQERWRTLTVDKTSPDFMPRAAETCKPTTSETAFFWPVVLVRNQCGQSDTASNKKSRRNNDQLSSLDERWRWWNKDKRCFRAVLLPPDYRASSFFRLTSLNSSSAPRYKK